MPHLFISYSKKDSEFANKLADDLKTFGFKIWMDRAIGGGELWRESIEKNLKTAREVIIVVSPNSMASEWVKHEGSLAYGWGKKLYPILIEKVSSLPPWLEEIQWVDFVQTSYQTALGTLVSLLSPVNPIQDLLAQQVLVFQQTGQLIGESILRVIEENPEKLIIDEGTQELIDKSKQVVIERQQHEQLLVMEREAARQSELVSAIALAQKKEENLRQLRIGLLISITLLGAIVFFAWSYFKQTKIANAQTAELRSLFLAENTNKLIDEGNSDLALALAMAAAEGDLLPEKAHIALQNAALSSMISNAYSLCSEWVSSVSLSPIDENIAAVGCSFEDKSSIQLFNLKTGEILREFNYPARIQRLTFSVGGENILAGYGDSNIVIWNTYKSGDKVLAGHTNSVSAVVYSPRGDLIASASYDKSILVWDIESLAIIQKIINLPEQLDINGKITEMAFSPDGKKIAYGDDMGNIVVWDLQRDFTQSTVDSDEHQGFVLSLKFSPDGNQLVSGGSDSTIRTWDITDRITLGSIYKIQNGWLHDVSYLPNGKSVLIASSDASITVLDLTTGQVIQKLYGHTNEVESVVVDKMGDYAISGGRDGRLILWDLKALYPVNSIRDETHIQAELLSLATVPNRDLVVVSTSKGSVQIWDHSLKKLVGNWDVGTENSAVWAMAVSPNGEELLTGSYNGQLSLWSIDSGLLIRNLKNQNVGIRSVDISPDGRRALTGYASGDLKIWDLITGEQVCVLQGHTNIVNDAKFTPDGDHVVSGSNDHNVLFWDIRTCDDHDLPNRLYSHQSWVMAVDISPGGRLVASGSSDQSIIIWDLVTERQLYRLQLPDTGSIQGIDGFVLSVSFSPDGRLITGSYANGSVAVWSVADGILLRRFISPPDASCIYGTRCFWVWDVVFSQIHDELITGSADGILHTWPLIPTSDLADLRLWVMENRFIRHLTEEEKSVYGIDEKK